MKPKTCLIVAFAPPADPSIPKRFSIDNFHFQIPNFKFQIVFCLLSSAFCLAGTYSGGSGTAEEPFQISTIADWQELIAASADWDKNFILLNDIDFSGIDLTPVAPAIDSTGWDGYEGIPFTGSLDGDCHILSNIKLCPACRIYTGLFGGVGAGGRIWNLVVENLIVKGVRYVGGLIAWNEYGTITGCHVSCTISGDEESSYFGGLVARNEHGTITACSVAGTVNGAWYVGGLVGSNNDGLITDCYTTSTVDGYDSVGGLVGTNDFGTIFDCYTTGRVSGGGCLFCGSFVGGLVGRNGSGSITACYATGAVSGVMYVGGLVGSNGGPITDCFATGAVSGAGDYVGGLVGSNGGPIQSCHATGTVGGCSWVGGLVGVNGKSGITASYATGTITGSFGTSFPSSTGGLVGENSEGPITNCYAHGGVSGFEHVGGLVGKNDYGPITNCYAHGGVSGFGHVGGLVGTNGGSIINSYATGYNSGMFGSGGLVEGNSGSITGCFWDVETTGCSVSAGGTGKTTAEMKMLSTFTDAGWDFSFADGDPADWRMPPNAYPRIVWQEGYSGGSGTAEDPYQISTVADFYAAGLRPSDWGNHFILIADLDLQDIPVSPIGKGEIPFSGDFEGGGHQMVNLTQTPFDRVDVSGRIRNLHIRNASIQEWEWAASGLVRYNFGVITNCTLEDSAISGTTAGGLVIWNYGSLTECSTRSEMPADYDNAAVRGGEVGGLVAWNYGAMTNCSGDGNVAGPVRGGLAAINHGVLIHCSVTADVFNYLGGYISGGLVAQNYGTLMNCSVTGTPGIFFGLVGGLVGKNYGSILRCRFDGRLNIWGEGAGLVAYNSGLIRDCYARGHINSESDLAGLVCINVGRVIHSYAACTISVEGSAGGLILKNSDRCGDYEECVEYEGMTLCNWVWKCLDHGEVISSFWDAELGWGSDGGVGKNTSQMKTKWTFTNAGWDFVGESANGTADTWRMCADGVDYPRLSWEFSDNGDFTCPDGVAMDDLLYLTARWLAATPAEAGATDANGDGKTNLEEFALLSAHWQTRYSGGAGTAEYPFQISTVADWQVLMEDSYDWDKYFVLTADLDLQGIVLSPVAPDTDAATDEFQGTPFSGVFDGNGYVLRNAMINQPDRDFAGLFGCLGPGGRILNLGMEGASVSGRSHVGILCGMNNRGTIRDCSATGGITNSIITHNLGGICGANIEGTIVGCFAAATMVPGDWFSANLGGLCGLNDRGTIHNCSAAGSITGDTQVNIGGLCGVNDRGTIHDCSAAGNMTGFMSQSLGGLCGVNVNGTIVDCYAAATVEDGGPFSNNVGGLCGWNEGGTIQDCSAAGTMTSEDAMMQGGLCGRNVGTIRDCSAAGSVINLISSDMVGGLCGRNYGTIVGCYSATKIKASDSYSDNIGGLCGQNISGTIRDCYAVGDVISAITTESMGGVCGINGAAISRCYAACIISGGTDSLGLGGLCGGNTGAVDASFWDIEITGLVASAGGTGKTTAQMKSLSTFTAAGWDFVGETANGTADIWRMFADGMDYPRLAWE